MKWYPLFLIVILVFTGLSSANPYSFNLYKPPTTQNITNIYNNITVNGTDLYLNNLTDVDVPSPSDGESLVWSSSLMKWISETVISRWIVDPLSNFLYNDSDTIYFNETKLNQTIDSRAATGDNDFHIFINGSSYNNINHNITAGDVDDVEFTIIPGKKFIFGDTFT